MSAESPVYILDSFAVLAYLQGEAGMPRIMNLLKDATQKKYRVMLSIINLGEVLYITERLEGLPRAQETLAALEQLPIDILPVERDTVLDAAHIKANRRMSYADTFAVVAAMQNDGIIITADPEFETVSDIVKIEWLPTNYPQALSGMHHEIRENMDVEKYLEGERQSWNFLPSRIPQGYLAVDGGKSRSTITMTTPSACDANTLARLFGEIFRPVSSMPDGEDKEKATRAVAQLESEARKGQQADKERIERQFAALAQTSPQAWNVAVETFLNPIPGISPIFQTIAQTARV